MSRLQSGFRPGTGTREGIFNLRTICERATDVQKDKYICFIDYTKAFDRVKHFKMMECLSEIGIDDKDLQIISKLCWEQSACVRTESGMTSELKIKKGVRQGCVLSPNWFNLYTEKIFREVEDMKGINIGGVNMNKKNRDCKNCIWEYGKDSNIKKHQHWIKIAHSKMLYLVNTFIWSRNMDTN